MPSTIKEMQEYAASQKASDENLTEKMNMIRRLMADIGYPMSEDMSLSDLRKVFSLGALNLDTAPEIANANGVTGYNRMPLLDAMMPSNAQYRLQSDPSRIVSGKQDPARSNCFKTTFRFLERYYDDVEVAFRIPLNDIISLTAKCTVEKYYPKEMIFINSGSDEDIMVYRNLNFGMAMCQGTIPSNFMALRTRHGIGEIEVDDPDIDGHADTATPTIGIGTYKSFWINTAGQNLSYIDQDSGDIVLVMPDEDYAEELINTEWTIYCQYSVTAPVETREPVKKPTYIYDLVQLAAIDPVYLALAGKKDSRIWLGSDVNTLMRQSKIGKAIFENVTGTDFASRLGLVPMTAVTNKKINSFGTTLKSSALTEYGTKSMDYTFGTLGKGTKWFVYSIDIGAILEPIRYQV
ncbi:MAG: hypothetical protein NC548_06125 [Lachnospiraceae bacterium]|nr:hypothetical protein [Lachnospiraceae bacterium]